MDNNSDIPENVRKALTRNRMLRDILNDEKQSSHEVLVQQRCLHVVRRVSAARRWRRRAAAIAAVAAMVMASIGGFWLLPDDSLTPVTVAAVNTNKIPLPPLTSQFFSVTNVSGFDTIHGDPTAGLLQFTPTAAIQTSMTISSSSSLLADSPGLFSVVSTSDLAMGKIYTEVSSSSLRGNFSESSPKNPEATVAIMDDNEFLHLPEVIGIVGFAGNQQVLLRPEKKKLF